MTPPAATADKTSSFFRTPSGAAAAGSARSSGLKASPGSGSSARSGAAGAATGSDVARIEARGATKFVRDSLQDHLTCAICCEVMVSPHVVSPCGHSYCGTVGTPLSFRPHSFPSRCFSTTTNPATLQSLPSASTRGSKSRARPRRASSSQTPPARNAANRSSMGPFRRSRSAL
ncbi:hypothetical protein DFJ73DRAFT_853283 [Zopfochytrium polystomum]|nr:hypothetical protein DFJ73DRAFT_853283 [Zopfochytrium polystomum]